MVNREWPIEEFLILTVFQQKAPRCRTSLWSGSHWAILPLSKLFWPL